MSTIFPTLHELLVTAIFLRLNGYRLLVEADESERFMIDDVIVGSADLHRIAGWLSRHMHPLTK